MEDQQMYVATLMGSGKFVLATATLLDLVWCATTLCERPFFKVPWRVVAAKVDREKQLNG